MVRSEDPPGKVKHIRFGKISDDIRASLEAFPGIKAIVLHKNGKRGEHPHYHIWWEGEIPVTNQTIRNRLKSHNDLFKSFSGQNDWSFRNHDSWSAWCEYVASNLSHMVLLGPSDLKEVSASKSVVSLVTELPGGASTTTAATVKYTVQKPRSHEALKDKFVKYLITERHYEDGQITLDNYFFSRKQLCREVIRKFHNGIATQQAAICVEYAMYEFANEEVREKIEDGLEGFLLERKILRC